mmetsp:Transcript_28883/g.43619  ORF Transcript_28883/g.43619 Transcript_28883/m.43619 type:complete len:83 (-) Transcript_28883:204-452(-)
MVNKAKGSPQPEGKSNANPRTHFVLQMVKQLRKHKYRKEVDLKEDLLSCLESAVSYPILEVSEHKAAQLPFSDHVQAEHALF